MEKCSQTRKHQYTFTILVFSRQCNDSKIRLQFCHLVSSAKNTDTPMSGSAVKNHGWPQMGRQLLAKQTISYFLSFQVCHPILSPPQESSSASSSPVTERSGEPAPRNWRDWPKSQNINSRSDKNRDSDDRARPSGMVRVYRKSLRYRSACTRTHFSWISFGTSYQSCITDAQCFHSLPKRPKLWGLQANQDDKCSL